MSHYNELIIQNLEKGSIELLPSCLNKLAECYEAQNNVQKACIFKKFEKMYYEQVLVKKSLDMIGLSMNALIRVSINAYIQTKRKRITRQSSIVLQNWRKLHVYVTKTTGKLLDIGCRTSVVTAIFDLAFFIAIEFEWNVNLMYKLDCGGLTKGH